MTTRLFAFFNDPDDTRLVGVFERGHDGLVSFRYADDTSGGTPLSLSLPRSGNHDPEAPGNYLENLLPDRKEVRQRWGRDAGVDPEDAMELLAVYGEDVAGAVSLTALSEFPQRSPQGLYEADSGSVAARIASLRHDETSWHDPREKPRMSLAGQQGKFAIARIRNRWFWPTFEVPSTHIIKPSRKDLASLDENEDGALKLAREIGLEASESDVITVEDQSAFQVTRWDRSGGFRVHAEDLAQSHGMNVADKYKLTAAGVLQMLRRNGAETLPFVRQLAFNTYIWNADAHAKNYSVLLDGDQVQLAPLYDAVPTRLYPGYDVNLAMPIGQAQVPRFVDASAWRKFAVEAGLDAAEVIDAAFRIRDGVAERFEEYMRPLDRNPKSARNLARHLKSLHNQAKAEPLTEHVVVSPGRNL